MWDGFKRKYFFYMMTYSSVIQCDTTYVICDESLCLILCDTPPRLYVMNCPSVYRVIQPIYMRSVTPFTYSFNLPYNLTYHMCDANLNINDTFKFGNQLNVFILCLCLTSQCCNNSIRETCDGTICDCGTICDHIMLRFVTRHDLWPKVLQFVTSVIQWF